MIEINEISQLQALIDTLEKSRFDFFELELEGMKIKLGKQYDRRDVLSPMPPMQQFMPQQVASPMLQTTVTASAQTQVEATVSASDGKKVTAPLVGIFYAASSPDNPAFVSVGSRVKKGDCVCIIEAMKIMNEIECEYDGVVTEILVKNGDPVEFGQPLFVIS